MLGKILTAVWLLLSWAFWIIFLAGTGAAQHACSKQGGGGGGVPTEGGDGGRRMVLADDLFNSHSRHLLAHSQNEICYNRYAFAWWAVWFQFVCLVLATLAAFSGVLMGKLGRAILAFFIMQTVTSFIVADSARAAIFSSEGATGKAKDERSGMQGALAGAIGVMVLNFLYIITMAESSGSWAPAFHSSAPADAGSHSWTPSTPMPVGPTTPASKPYPGNSTPSYPSPAGAV